VEGKIIIVSIFKNLFRRIRSAKASGIIGRASGPASIFIAQKEQEQEEFLLQAAEKITPCERSFKELEQFLIEKYNAVPHKLSPQKLDCLKVNVIINYYGHLLDRPAPLGENPTEEEIKAYFEKQEITAAQAKEYPAEKLGLEMKAYKLPGIISKRQQFASSNADRGEDAVIVEMEMKSGYLAICNSSGEVNEDLILYLGVSEKDINEKSPRFISYAYALRSVGRL
jgi:hypothetical protein